MADGIIPAHAGFTRPGGGRHPDGADHPRTRGVYRDFTSSMLVSRGSSPHTRGLRVGGQGVGAPARIIPAHAGFTFRLSRNSTFHPDHPRTRGVYARCFGVLVDDLGSSPHTRGLRPVALEEVGDGRIIPAHAGFTRRQRVRHHGARIIPAHAGFTTPPRRRAPPGSDHPRTRGVYRRISAAQVIPSGSSPHTRGLQTPARVPHHLGGIIPAHAGFTTMAGIKQDRCVVVWLGGARGRSRRYGW